MLERNYQYSWCQSLWSVETNRTVYCAVDCIFVIYETPININIHKFGGIVAFHRRWWRMFVSWVIILIMMDFYQGQLMTYVAGYNRYRLNIGWLAIADSVWYHLSTRWFIELLLLPSTRYVGCTYSHHGFLLLIHLSYCPLVILHCLMDGFTVMFPFWKPGRWTVQKISITNPVTRYTLSTSLIWD